MIDRPPWSHKGDFGRVLIVGGSREYAGAPALSGMAALSARCDLCTIAAPEKVAWSINGLYPDLITHKLSGDYLSPKHFTEIKRLLKRSDALLIGPGLGDRPETLKAAASLIASSRIPTVIDADAFKIPRIPAGKILTPHAKEFFHAFGVMPSTDIEQRKQLVARAAKKSGCTLLLKGHIDLISDGTRTAENRTGTPFMTVGGTGDTLSGILAALLSQKMPAFDACRKAAWCNGKAGSECLKHEHRVLASRLINYIPLFV